MVVLFPYPGEAQPDADLIEVRIEQQESGNTIYPACTEYGGSWGETVKQGTIVPFIRSWCRPTELSCGQMDSILFFSSILSDGPRAARI
jgi:hypothetical protein